MGNFNIADILRNAGADAQTALANGGFVRGYNGSQPASVSVAVTTQTDLFDLRFGSPAFGAAVAGVATANALTADSSANADGKANWFRAFKTDGTTPLWDGCILNQTVTLSVGAALNAVALTVAALTGALYAGQDLWFIDAVSGARKKASVTVDAAAGATSVTVSALAAAIAVSSTAVGDMVLNSCAISSGAAVSVSSLTYTIPSS